VIAFHISNRHLDLEPVIGRLASELGLKALVTEYRPAASGEWGVNLLVVARSIDDLGAIGDDPAWTAASIGDTVWTDNFSDILGVIRLS
jgi:hypothetical protein